MYHFKRINPNNIDDIITLLFERNRTIPAYTRWKYSDSQKDFYGFIAYNQDKPVGCFGLLPRLLHHPNGDIEPCGWFSDWYVTPPMRGTGLGRDLLCALSNEVPLIYGHPGTDKAQNICRGNGYVPLVFQSFRRLILNPLVYEKSQTKYFFKAAVKSLLHRTRFTKKNVPLPIQPLPLISFQDTESFGHWILKQPNNPTMKRYVKTWENREGKMIYFDEMTLSGIRRFRILYTSGLNNLESWYEFRYYAGKEGAIYCDFFTTNQLLDAILSALNAQKIVEKPVLVYGAKQPLQSHCIHGWDRENWTYAAYLK